MRLGLLTDIHENVEALHAALARFREENVDQVVVLGDLFRMGERINPVCQSLLEVNAVGVWGNHDFGWTGDRRNLARKKFGSETADFLGKLQPRLKLGGCLFTHVEPWLNPNELVDLWYFEGPPDQENKVQRIFDADEARVMFAGHYHRWQLVTPNGIAEWDGATKVRLASPQRYFIVVGALTEGRFAVYDTETEWLVPYQLPQNDPSHHTLSPVDESVGTIVADPDNSPPPPGRNSSLKSTSMLAPPQDTDEIGRLGEFRVLKILGSGGMGIVFLATNDALQRPTALKVMRPLTATSDEARRRFLREAKSVAAIKHEHVVSIYQAGHHDGVPFLAMEFLNGVSLETLLRRNKPFRMRDLVRIARQTAEGLAAAHARGVIHRDVKPGNIWLEIDDDKPSAVDEVFWGDDSSGAFCVKLLDFGLARAVDDDTRVTRSGIIVGTPAYMAPEQAEGKSIDPRIDLFSLGCVLYQMCTGRLPFQGETTMAILRSLALDQPLRVGDQNSAVTNALCGLIDRLLAKNPEDRPATATAVADELRAIEQAYDDSAEAVISQPRDESAFAQAPTVVAKTPDRALDKKSQRRSQILTAIAAAGVVGILICIGWLVWKVGFPAAPVDPSPKTVNKKPKPPKPPKDNPKSPPKRNITDDRRFAEWIINIGGSARITLDHKHTRDVFKLEKLPKQRIYLTGVRSWKSQKVTTDSLKDLGKLKHFYELRLEQAPIGNRAAAHLARCRSLATVDLTGTSIDDAGLVHLLQLPIYHLNLSKTRITDAGVAQLTAYKRIGELALRATKVSDKSVPVLSKLKTLTVLDLRQTKVTKEGHAQLAQALKGCKIRKSFGLE